MKRPLYETASDEPTKRPSEGHAGLWFDKFCRQWRTKGEAKGTSWSMASDKANDNPKLKWIQSMTKADIGDGAEIKEQAQRLASLIDGRQGRWKVFTTESRFVTGLGRSHPVENGFAWHPTLGTPYLPGSSVKGLVRTWAQQDDAA